jgi:MoxR-like ATPase
VNHNQRHPLPLAPLLDAYTGAAPSVAALTSLPGWGPRWQAIAQLSETLVAERFLDHATDAELHNAVLRLYEAVVPWPLHPPTRREAALVRHAVGHLLRCPDPLVIKIERCLTPNGAYFVPGLGGAFWSAVLRGMGPAPAWVPTVMDGLRRLGLVRGPHIGWADLAAAYTQIRAVCPTLTLAHIDHFCAAVAAMEGRDLAAIATSRNVDLFRGGVAHEAMAALLRQQRAEVPLRSRLRERAAELEGARRQLDDGIARSDGNLLRQALQTANAAAARIDWSATAPVLATWLRRLRDAAEPYETLAEFWCEAPISGASLWLPTAALHLLDPHRFPIWDESARTALARLDDAVDVSCPAQNYRLFAEAVACFRQRIRAHPLEMPGLLAALVQPIDRSPSPPTFHGFSPDTFRFLQDLTLNNQRRWMDANRARYHFALRGPLTELCQALATRYVAPVLGKEYGWCLETEAKAGRALTSINKNDYGQTVPYQTALWVTFYRRNPGGRRSEAQLFVRVDAAGVTCGFRIGREGKTARARFRVQIANHADLVLHTLTSAGAFGSCNFGEAAPTRAADLVTWADRPDVEVSRTFAPDAPCLRSEALVGEVLLTFDRLLPLLACALEETPSVVLSRLAGSGATPSYTEETFLRDTHLADDWLQRARKLLDLKGQLILQGVPGTGKTHVARCLGRLLTGGDHAVRLVQFHPAYSYEEFVEGIRVRTVEHDGRHDVTYPVEDGLLCAFAAEADRRPSEPFVLIIDEINRGNLPRIFGELLFLLEYRGQAVQLPYSQRAFRLPANLYVIGTMNAADRSVALVDQALRRRFSFLDMPPDAAVLAAWLRGASIDAEFAARVVAFFERLNVRLSEEMGPQARVGHSYFMVSGLDEARLRVIWQHHIRPLLDELFAGRPKRAAAYDFEELWAGKSRRRRRSLAAVQ